MPPEEQGDIGELLIEEEEGKMASVMNSDSRVERE